MEFQRPSRKPREEPAGLTEFAAGAAVTRIPRVVPEAEASAPEALSYPKPEAQSPKPAASPFNVRLGVAAKRALERLARADGRSQNQVLTRLVEPLLLDAARKLER
jgi:hypothetical protein